MPLSRVVLMRNDIVYYYDHTGNISVWSYSATEVLYLFIYADDIMAFLLPIHFFCFCKWNQNNPRIFFIILPSSIVKIWTILVLNWSKHEYLFVDLSDLQPLVFTRGFHVAFATCRLPAGKTYPSGHLVPSLFGTCICSNCRVHFP